MVVPKINSSHGSETRNIINAAIDSINAQGKSIQDLVAEGQLTPTQYAQLISIVNGNVSKGSITAADIDKNNFKLDQTYMSDTLLQQMAGNTPINAVPADRSITTGKLADKSTNREKLSDRFLFNGRIPVDNPIENVVNDGTYIVTGGNSGTFPEGESSASAWGMNVEVVNVNWVYQTIFKLDRPDIRYTRVIDNINTVVYSWHKQAYEKEEDTKHKKVLMIGNSFSLNATKYVPAMCAEQGVDVTIGILYRSGETLENHLINAQSNDAIYTYYERTSINGVTNLTTHTNFTFSQALERNEWEYVTFQQRSSDSNKYETYQPFLTDLKSFVETNLTQTVNYGVLQTWALSSTVNPNQQEAYTSIVGAYRQAMIDSDLSFILPAGTAIQSARGVAEINAIDDELTDDGYHLGELGMYIASAAVFESLYRGDCSIEKTFYKADGMTNYQRFVSTKVSQNAVNCPERITEL